MGLSQSHLFILLTHPTHSPGPQDQVARKGQGSKHWGLMGLLMAQFDGLCEVGEGQGWFQSLWLGHHGQKDTPFSPLHLAALPLPLLRILLPAQPVVAACKRRATGATSTLLRAT